jgi:acyl carrier protein
MMTLGFTPLNPAGPGANFEKYKINSIMKEQLFDLVREALEIEDRELSLDDNFKEFEEWDSLGQLSIIAALDENFGVVIEGAAFAKINTLGELLAKVEELSA